MAKILKLILETARGVLQEKGYIHPMGFCLIKKTIEVIPLNFKNEMEKFKSLYSFGWACRDMGSDAAERVVTGDGDYVKGNWDTEAPLNYPESMRQEVLILVGINFLKGETFLIKQYYRKGDDGVIIFGALKIFDTKFVKSGLLETIQKGYDGIR